jgi:hypothetical protein
MSNNNKTNKIKQMTQETYEQAARLVQTIAYDERAISMLETILNKFDDHVYTQIAVTCKGGPGDIGLSIPHRDLPELRDALHHALARFRQTLQENREELEKL